MPLCTSICLYLYLYLNLYLYPHLSLSLLHQRKNRRIHNPRCFGASFSNMSCEKPGAWLILGYKIAISWDLLGPSHQVSVAGFKYSHPLVLGAHGPEFSRKGSNFLVRWPYMIPPKIQNRTKQDTKNGIDLVLRDQKLPGDVFFVLGKLDHADFSLSSAPGM